MLILALHGDAMVAMAAVILLLAWLGIINPVRFLLLR